MPRVDSLAELQCLVNGMTLATSFGFHREAKEGYRDLTVVYDLETTGFTANSLHSCQVVQVAARVLQNMPDNKEYKFDSLVKLERDKFIVSHAAMKAHGIDEKRLAAADPWPDVWKRFFDWLQTLFELWNPETITLVAYSSSHMDTKFVIRGATVAKIPIPGYLRFADAYHVLQCFTSKEFQGCPRKRLIDVFERFTGHELNPELLHEAWPDTLTLSAVLLAANAMVRVDVRSPLVVLLHDSHMNDTVQNLLRNALPHDSHKKSAIN